MVHEEKKIGKIVEELTMYFFSIGSDKITTYIEREGNQVLIDFKGNFDPKYRNKLATLEEYLNEEKDHSIEDIYWELAGSGDPGESSQLLLLGMMIDKAEVNIKEDCVYLRLYKELIY